jgi:hypothetical protein
VNIVHYRYAECDLTRATRVGDAGDPATFTVTKTILRNTIMNNFIVRGIERFAEVLASAPASLV